MKPTRFPQLAFLLTAILFLFFFQLITDFVEAIYAFGLLGTAIPPELGFVLLLFSPLALLFLKRSPSPKTLTLFVMIMLLSRAVEVYLDTRGKMILSGLGVAAFFFIFPLILQTWKEGKDTLTLGVGLSLGISLSILLREVNSGVDLSNMGGWRALNPAIALIGAALLFSALKAGQPAEAPSRPASGKVIGLALGLIATLTLLYFTLTAPNVLARWTGRNNTFLVSVAAISLYAFTILLCQKRPFLTALTPKVLFLWNALFMLCLEWVILPYQFRFPATPQGYPLAEPVQSPLLLLPLLLTLLLSPVIVVDLIFFCRELAALRPSPRQMAMAFGLGSFFLLWMIFGQVFTTVYDYIPVVGLFFRDKFYLAFLVAGIVMTFPVLLLKKETFALEGKEGREVRLVSLVASLVVVGILISLFLTAARPPEPNKDQKSLRVLTYNIQQGYSENGLRNFEGQLEVMRRVNADLIGLQESDTNRIAGGNADLVRYFSDRLELYSYYGPNTVVGTFGIALLSKFPIHNPRTFYMYSEGEQTAIIEAQISLGGKTFNVYVTHLGNGGPLIQQEEVMQVVQGKENVILMGDFNFRPDEEPYHLTTATLRDSWLLVWPQGNPAQGVDALDRIDHIFVSPATKVLDSQYLVSPASDHPAMMSEIGW
jgi:endonuclease/exonuclease/phosphatase family metal-dependent hydrolase